MEFNANGFVHNRSKQILAMYGVYPDQIQKSNEEAQLQVTQELQKSEEQTKLAQQETIAASEAELKKGQEEVNLENQNTENEFSKSLADLMSPITFD